MSAAGGAAAPRHEALGAQRMSAFERWLTLWVALCIVFGVALGQLFPATFQVIGHLEIARVNLPVGALIWIMIVPMLLRIDFGALHQVKRHWRGVTVTLIINWAVKPFSADPARGGAVHGHGLCLEPAHQRRSLLHAHAGCHQ